MLSTRDTPTGTLLRHVLGKRLSARPREPSLFDACRGLAEKPIFTS